MDEQHTHSNPGPSAPDRDIIGPAPVDPEHFDSLIRLLDLVMRPDSPRSMTEDFPFFLRQENCETLFVCRDGDRIVSHVGLLPMEASYFGHQLKIGMIGAVATHPDYRLRGLATRTLHKAFKDFREQGGHLLMISGRRDLYFRNGAREVGAFRRYDLDQEEAPLGRSEGLELERADASRAAEFAAMHRLKPVRFLRPLEEWTSRMEEGVCRNRLSKFCLASRNGQPTAYGIFRVEEVGGETECVVTEWGGRPEDAFLAVSRRVREEKWARSQWTLYPHENHMAHVLESSDARLRGEQAAEGSLRVADFVGLMEALRGHFRELIGREMADSLQFQQCAPDLFSIGLNEESVRIQGHGKLAEVIFGPGLHARSEPVPEGDLRDALSVLFPLSPMNYDFSYA